MEFKKIEEKLKNEWYDATEEVDVNALINAIHPLEHDSKKGGLFWILGISAMFMAFGLMTYSAYQKGENALTSEIKNKEIINTNTTKTNINPANPILNKIDVPSNGPNHNLILSKPESDSNSEKTINNPVSSTKEPVTLDVNKQNVLHDVLFAEKNSTSDNNEDALMVLPQKVSSLDGMDILNTIPKVIALTSFIRATEKQLLLPKVKSPCIKGGPIKCPSFSKPKWSFAVGAEAGVFNPFKKLELIDIQDKDMYDIRTDNEKSLEGLQASVYMQLNSERIPFYFKLGGTYSHITEKLTLNTTSIEQDTTFGIISITESQNGDTLTVIYGNIISDVTIEKQSVVHHYFSLVDIPVSVGYNFELSKKVYLGLEAGVNVNILSVAKGRLLQNSSTTENVNDLKAFANTVGLNYFSSLNLGLRLNDNHAIYLNTKFSYNPHNFASRNNTIGQKYSFGGVNIGYSYRF